MARLLWSLAILVCVLPGRAAADGGSEAPDPFVFNTIGPEKLLPLNRRGLIRLIWKPYEGQTRFALKPYEQPLYRILIAPKDVPASEGRVHVTYDNSYPFTNLEAGKEYNVRVEVEQTGTVVLAERTVRAAPVEQLVKWYAAPRAEGGDPSHSGTYDSPKDISFVNGNAGPGDVIVIKSGVYFSPGTEQAGPEHDRALKPEQSGRPGARILFLAESNDVMAGRYVSFRTAWGNIYVNKAEYVLFDGINCDSDQGRNAKALTSLFGEYGRPTGVIIRDIYYRAPTSDKQIMLNGCREFLIENCFFPGSLDSHNVYLCNNTHDRPEFADSRGVFRNCVAMNSTRNNVHANGFFDNFIIENNVFAGAEVANISLGTVHRNTYVRNNIAYCGAKQAITLNFYQSAEFENRFPCSNIQICHNTFVVPETTEYLYPAIIVSDTRRLPYRHVIRGLSIKNNILVNLKEGSKSGLIELWQARHLREMEVEGNLWYAKGDAYGHQGEVILPWRGESVPNILPFSRMEEIFESGEPFSCRDVLRDGNDNEVYEDILVKLRPWRSNRPVDDLGALFENINDHTFIPLPRSPAYDTGVVDSQTRRVVRDLFGNVRGFAKGEVCCGAIAAPTRGVDAPLLSEYVLSRPAQTPFGAIVPGQRCPTVSGILTAKSRYETVLESLGVTFEVEKTSKAFKIDVPREVHAEVEINGRNYGLAFFKEDQAGNEKIWITGWAHGMGIRLADGEQVVVTAFLRLDQPGRLKSVISSFNHDNIWAYDGRGWKAAVTGVQQVGIRQGVQ